MITETISYTVTKNIHGHEFKHSTHDKAVAEWLDGLDLYEFAPKPKDKLWSFIDREGDEVKDAQVRFWDCTFKVSYNREICSASLTWYPIFYEEYDIYEAEGFDIGSRLSADGRHLDNLPTSEVQLVRWKKV